jgi:hypothetical protein
MSALVPDFQAAPGAAPPPRDFPPRGRRAEEVLGVLADHAAPRRRRMKHLQHGDLLSRMQLPDGFVAAVAVPVESFAHRLDLAPTQPLAGHGHPAAPQDADQSRTQIAVPHQPGQGAVDAEERVGRLRGRRQSYNSEARRHPRQFEFVVALGERQLDRNRARIEPLGGARPNLAIQKIPESISEGIRGQIAVRSPADRRRPIGLDEQRLHRLRSQHRSGLVRRQNRRDQRQNQACHGRAPVILECGELSPLWCKRCRVPAHRVQDLARRATFLTVLSAGQSGDKSLHSKIRAACAGWTRAYNTPCCVMASPLLSPSCVISTFYASLGYRRQRCPRA